jgi:hypothetical protein
MPSPATLSDKPIYTIVEEDIQTVARFRLHRELSRLELDTASRLFGNALDWWEIAECAVDLAVEEDRNSQPR